MIDPFGKTISPKVLLAMLMHLAGVEAKDIELTIERITNTKQLYAELKKYSCAKQSA